MQKISKTIHSLFFPVLTLLLFFVAEHACAATLRLSPDTGVFTAGSTFTVQVLINTQSKPVNAADAQLAFNPRELSVVGVSKGSIFNLWTQDPTYSNSGGTISFGGGSPSGYTGTAGSVMSISFRALASGNPKVSFVSGSVLAADGMGTNVLTGMTGSSFTIGAKTTSPEPEYIAPPNTPTAPKIVSSTHSEQSAWYKNTTALVSWELPTDVIAVRTLLDQNEGTIPTKVYEERITSRELTELPQGISYFHIQFKNTEGWGKVAHFRLGIDSEEPKEFSISEVGDADDTNPSRILSFKIDDRSPILEYRIHIDGGEEIVRTGDDATSTYALPVLPPGHHSVVVNAIDSAGNNRIATYAFLIASFEPPVFTEFPTRMSTGVIPALRGTTRNNAELTITVANTDGVEHVYTTRATETGSFTFIPDSSFARGVYDITAYAVDVHGAKSELSQSIRIIVEESGYVRIGSYIVSVLSVVIPSLALLFVLIFGCWYLYYKLRDWQKRVRTETREIDERLQIEFNEIIANLKDRVHELKNSRKGKLTRAELALIEQMEYDIDDARTKISKEIADVERIVK